MKKSRMVIVFGLLVAVVVIIASMAIFAPRFFRLETPGARADQGVQSTGTPEADRFFLAKIFEESSDAPRSTFLTTLEIIQRLLLAVLLSGILAFRPRQNVPLFKSSLFVSQTQILLAVVAAALMLIVGDNAARAFA